jgi:hypothetical protein
MLAASGAVDAAMGQVPFGWIVANVDHNIIRGASERFGVDGPSYYLQLLIVRWGALAPVLILLPLLVARRYPALFCAAIVNLLVHTGIAHKEYRFIWLTVEILVLLSAIGSADLLRRLLDWLHAPPRGRITGTAMLLVAWAGGSVGIAQSERAWSGWNHVGASMRATADAGQIGRLCGLAVYRFRYWSASYVYLRRDVPIYLPIRRDPAEDLRVLARHAPAYNIIMAPPWRAALGMPPGYREVSCRKDGSERVCLYQRPGGCTPKGAEFELLQNTIARYVM